MHFRSRQHLLEPGVIVIALGLFLWGLWGAFHAPIYPDEVAYRLFLERFFVADGLKQSVTPYCAEGFLVAPPTLLLPAAATWSLLSFFGGGYWSYRIVPAVCWLIIFASLYWHGRRHGSQSFWLLLLLLLPGPSIYSLILLRPEIVLLMLGVLIYVWGSNQILSSRFIPVLLSALLIGFIYSLALYMHPKIVYLAPALVLALSLRFRDLPTAPMRFTFLVAGYMLIGGLVLSAIWLHKLQYTSCAAYPALAETMNMQAVNPLQFFSAPIQFFVKLKEAFSPSLWALTAERLSYWSEYQVAFLPGTVAATSTLVIIRCVVVIAFTLVVVTSFVSQIKTLSNKPTRSKFWPAILLLTVGLGLIGPFLLNLKRHFYDVSLLASSIVVIACLTQTLLFEKNQSTSEFKRRVLKVALPFILLCMGILGTIMNVHFVKRFLAGYEGPSISIQKLPEQKRLAVRISQSLEKIGVANHEPLLIDDFTYDWVWEHPRLYPITYMTVHPSVVKDVAINLASYDIHYGVVRCSYLASIKPLVPVSVVETIRSPIIEDICVFTL